jgi:glycosyltransferase involved in cell wall biosynthesis
MKKILYISYDGMTDPLGQSQVIPYLNGLREFGYEFHVLSFEKPHIMKKEGNSIRRLMNSAGLFWYPQRYTSKPPVISKIMDVQLMKKKAYELHKKFNFSVVHVRSYMPALAALSMKKKYGVKFIFDMRGLWADERVEGKIWNLKNPVYYLVYRYFKMMERKFLRNADYIISHTNIVKPLLHQLAGVDSLPVHIIPCCADLEHFNYRKICAKDKIQTFQKLGLNPNEKVLSYLGSLGTWYLLDEMLDFFKLAKERGVLSKFLFLTMETPDYIYDKALQKGLNREDLIVMYGSREQVPSLLSLSYANIFFIKPCFSKMASSPTKFGEVLGLGIPVITNAGVGDVEQQVRDSGVGMIVRDFSREAMLETIEQMEEINHIDKVDCRLTAYKYFDLKAGIDHYAEVYKKLLPRSGNKKSKNKLS